MTRLWLIATGFRMRRTRRVNSSTSRMIDVIRSHAKGSAAASHDALMHAVQAFTGMAVQHDDITAVVMEYKP